MGVAGPVLLLESRRVCYAGAMQKSKSSSSVVHHGSRIVSKKMWRARSKSQSRAVPSVTSTWTPQGHCVWSNVTGAQVVLADTSLVQLTDLERRLLQKVALAKLQALNLGVAVRVPSETLAGEAPHKPKRRPHLLKRKALTTSFFDTVAGKGADKDKDPVAGSGLVFGIPISQCLENDRLARGSEGSGVLEADKSRLRRRSHHGSRSSCASLSDSAHPEESGSCESLDLVAGSVPGQLDALGSTGDLLGLEEREPGVPSLVAACCRHLEAHGLHTLGIFRVSSSKKRVRQLREVFDSGKETQLDDQVCPHDVATLLKEFFRDLPEPLLCRDLYHAFVRTQRIRNRRLQLEALQHLVQQLPVPNRDTLWALLTFLSKVALHAGDYTDERGESVAGNKMDSSNLATLFAPNILHRIRPGSAKDVSAETSDERADAISVVRAMIDQHQALFTVSAELLDEVYLHLMDSHPEALDHLLRRRGVPTDMGDTGVDPDSDPLGAEPHTVRRVWSREEFLHESAAMGGPDMGMRPRHKERLRHSKKHWWEEAEDGSSDAGSSPRRKSSPVLLDASPSVITASLKIPAPIAAEDDLTPVGATRSRQRHASTSGSDSSAVVPLPRALSPASSVSPPPSWASSPPNSPDGTVTCVDYLPDHPSRQQRAVALTAKEITPVILHKVTFAQAGGEQRMQLLSQPGGGELLPKSASASCVPPCPERDQPPPASISSIGGAVMRSKTADIERILRIHQPVEPADAKKYSKRRYTDARHQTGLLPDCEAPASAAPSSRPVPVYKRRELIASDPSDHETFL
ncbi:rho GTPase-activating protein 6-like [Bacillus rossius redtenbacheri]|uniref:rho GTPase-activating protein 6-like n=1 Tax=Bacillus rossius redtenbacheri TaxID=93214 RepID=UPI002FDC8E0A